MHVISRKPLIAFGVDHVDAFEPLDRWYRIAKRATWVNFAAVKADFPTADLAGKSTIFNIGGNKYRLITEIFFDTQVLGRVLTL